MIGPTGVGKTEISRRLSKLLKLLLLKLKQLNLQRLDMLVKMLNKS